MADFFGKEIIVSSAADASATGAAILGLKAIGEINDLHFPVKATQPGEHFCPMNRATRGLSAQLSYLFHVVRQAKRCVSCLITTFSRISSQVSPFHSPLLVVAILVYFLKLRAVLGSE